VGSTACGWLGTLQKQGFDFSFWFGNQGLEFTSMGRFWQVLLFVGLLFWLTLLGRALWPALKRPSETRGLIAMVFLSATCIGAFYATSLVWGQRTHYAMIEYWRWWLVHLWVEGFFEVFATAVVGLIFTRLGLVAASSANRAIVLETIVFLTGGILGTLHHLYWTGTPTSVIAVGAVFSALEVVPLALLGFEGWHNYKRSRAAPWVAAYRWPILCFVAVGFWNTVGAGLLGFVINPPASLYYVQGLNLTPAHGHAALFGVYGMLGIGLMLFCLRGLYARCLHADRWLAWMFWGLNIGLAMMVFMSLLPAGIYQAHASITEGLWFARSPEIVHSKVMETLVWLRVPGDIVFALGAASLGIYALKLLRPDRRTRTDRALQPV
jgi:nitric oxide reductase subunit B